MTCAIVPWRDSVVESRGHDPRGSYAEVCWLPVIGPSSLFMLRRLVSILDDGDHAEVDLATLATMLGLPAITCNRTLRRLVQFDLVSLTGDTLAVRTALAPLPERLVRRLPEAVQAYHQSATGARR